MQPHATMMVEDDLPDVELLLSKIVTIDMGDDGTSSASFLAEKKLIVEIT